MNNLDKMNIYDIDLLILKQRPQRKLRKADKILRNKAIYASIKQLPRCEASTVLIVIAHSLPESSEYAENSSDTLPPELTSPVMKKKLRSNIKRHNLSEESYFIFREVFQGDG